jgi:predicted transposase/invertase (TIGR01784 family)
MMFINPKTDFAFKKIFGSKESTDILISFLNGILHQGEDVIVDLVILDPYQAPRIKGMKDSFLDIKATLRNHQTVIIEMQVLNTLGFEKRILYNAAKAYSTQLRVGENYTLLNPIIAVTITDFEMFPDSPKVVSSYALREKETLTTYSDDIELVFVELTKFKKVLAELETLGDKWIYFLCYASQLESVPTDLGEVGAIGHAFEVAQQSKLTRKELEALEKREMFLHDNRNAVLLAEKLAEKKGRKEGLQEGVQTIALNCLREGMAIDLIVRVTGLSPESIQKLSQTIQEN